MPIRVRLALAAGVITLVLAAVGGFFFVRSFRSGQVDALDRGLVSQADTLARQLRSAPTVDLGAPGPSAIVATGEVVVQVLGPDGEVIDSTQEAGPRTVVDANTVARASRGREFTDVELDREREPFRVIARPVAAGNEARVLVVGVSLEETEASVERVEQRLLVGGAAAVFVAIIGGWLLAGAALRPVERMRRQAAAISEHDTDSQLQVPRTRDEIASLGATMNALLDRLRGALEQQRDFVADAGHELRTPLAVLQAELELARRKPRTAAELHEAIEHAALETDRLARLADELLFLARDDADQVTAQRELVDLAPLLGRVVRAFSALAGERGVQIRAETEPGLVADLDADLVRRALDNLLENALRYAPPASAVEVRADRPDGHVEITVRDRGPGFPEEFLPHTFERFRRAQEARGRDDGGAGLGLAIVSAVAHAHHGKASAANAPGGGAIVTLTFPHEM
jgi:two-component system, OmpR family, sensor kinase